MEVFHGIEGKVEFEHSLGSGDDRIALICIFDRFTFSDKEEAKFIEASKTSNLIPLHKCIFSDHLTPVLAYRCLVDEDDRETPSFLFESVEPGSRSSTVVRHLICQFSDE